MPVVQHDRIPILQTDRPRFSACGNRAVGTATSQWRSRCCLRAGPGLVEGLARGLFLRGVHEDGLDTGVVDHVDLPAGSDLLEFEATQGVLATLDATKDDLRDLSNLHCGVNDDAG